MFSFQHLLKTQLHFYIYGQSSTDEDLYSEQTSRTAKLQIKYTDYDMDEYNMCMFVLY